jgi:serine/threonine protein kinase
MADVLADVRAALPPDYEVSRSLCGGGQGSVFDGRLRGARVAVKIFLPTTDPTRVARRVAREVAALQSIDCPFLVKVRDACQITFRGQPHELVAYEFLDGPDLSSLLGPGAARPNQSEILRMGHQIGTAVEALWARRIVHRDVKPTNIIHAATDRYVLVDLGLARHLDRSAITLPGGNPGTPGYASPEQAMGRQNLTISSDVFSLGLTLYEMAAGVHPFGRNQLAIGRVVPVPLSTRRPDLSGETCRLIDSMIAVPPYRRPAAIGTRFGELLNV